VLGAREARPGLRKGGPTQQCVGLLWSVCQRLRGYKVDLPTHTLRDTQTHKKVLLHSTTRSAIEHERERRKKKKEEERSPMVHCTQLRIVLLDLIPHERLTRALRLFLKAIGR
jgi:hypothetical protein